MPWSVPPSPFSSGRRPNSENVIIATCGAQRAESVEKNAAIALSSCAEQRGVPVALVGVRVEAVDLGVDDPDPEVRVDQVRGEHELLLQVVRLVREPVRGPDSLASAS